MHGQFRNRRRDEDDRGVLIAKQRERQIMRIAARQHGLITRRQLLGLGIGTGVINHRLRTGRLRPFRRGIYLVTPTTPPLAPEMAAILSCPEGSVLVGPSAAYLHQLLPHPAQPRLVHVAVRGHDPGRKPGIRIHRSRIPADERTSRHGIPLTIPARTIVDLAATLDASTLEQVVAEAHRRNMASADDLLAVLARHPRRAGARALRGLLNADRSPGFLRSRAEKRLLVLLRKARLPEPETNAKLGAFEIDYLWRDERLATEVDGGAFHTALPDRRRDQAKDAELLRAGYKILRLGWHQITEEPEATVALIARMLERRAAR
ncbi:MAG: DUF559 domain-containing protein [Solirubrobacterales bacterium]